MTGPTDAQRALASARKKLAEDQARRPRVENLARRLAEIRTQNHFADSFRQALGSKP